MAEFECEVARREEVLHLGTGKMAMGLAARTGGRLVHIGNNDIAGVSAYHARKLLSLTHTLRKLEAAHLGKQRQVGLRHKTEAVTPLIYLILNRTLSKPQEVHIAELGKEYIVAQLIYITAHNILLFKAHGICALARSMTAPPYISATCA